MYLSSKADLVKNGLDPSNLMELVGTNVDEISDLKALVLDIIDGYHRYGALILLRTNPAALLASDLLLDWDLLVVRYPSWIKMDR